MIKSLKIDIKGVIRSRKSNNNKSYYNDQKEKKKTITYTTLHRKLKIELDESSSTSVSELFWTGRISSSCSTSDTRRVLSNSTFINLPWMYNIKLKYYISMSMHWSHESHRLCNCLRARLDHWSHESHRLCNYLRARLDHWSHESHRLCNYLRARLDHGLALRSSYAK